MTNDLTSQEPNDDDGYGGSLTPSQSIRNYARWTDTAGWFDRDGQPLPATMLAPAINEGLQKWKNNVVDYIWAKPLPDAATLNCAIPKTEWEKDLNNDLRPPWEKIVAVILVDPSTGAVYRFTSSTIGARIAYDALHEAVVTMRMLRNSRVIPLVNLDARPFKTKKYGMKKRPHFQIVGWKSPGEDDEAIATKPASQLSGPTTAAAPPAPPPTPAPAAAPTPATDPAPPYQAKPKRPVNLASETLNAMGDAKPVTTGEILDDSIPW